MLILRDSENQDGQASSALLPRMVSCIEPGGEYTWECVCVVAGGGNMCSWCDPLHLSQPFPTAPF